MPPELRSSADNGIWLCQNCAKLIDNDTDRFTSDVLRRWKAAAELSAMTEVGRRADASLEGQSEFSLEEVEILVRAATEGEILLIPSEPVPGLGRWIRVGRKNFVDQSDPALAASFRDALEALEARDLVRWESGCLYVLTGSGFKVARALKAITNAPDERA